MVYSQEPSCRYLTVEHHWPNCKLKTNKREKKEKPLNAARLRPQPAPARRCSRIELIGKPSAAPEENLTMNFCGCLRCQRRMTRFKNVCHCILWVSVSIVTSGVMNWFSTHDLLPPTPCHGVARPWSPCPHLWVHRRKRGFRFDHFFQMDYDAYDVARPTGLPGLPGLPPTPAVRSSFDTWVPNKVSPKKHWIVLVLMDPKKKLNWWQAVNMLELNDENWLGMAGASHFWCN